MTAVNPGPASAKSGNSQSLLGSYAIVRVTLGAGPYDLDSSNVQGFNSGGVGIMEITSAAGGTTINTISALNSSIRSELMIMNTGTGNLLFNNLGGTGALAPYGFNNMNGGQVVIYPGGGALCRRIIPAGTTQGFWQFV